MSFALEIKHTPKHRRWHRLSVTALAPVPLIQDAPLYRDQYAVDHQMNADQLTIRVIELADDRVKVAREVHRILSSASMNSLVVLATKPYNVTLPWNPSDSSEGDYSTTVWAISPTDALLLAAEEMADSADRCYDTNAERTAFIEALLDHEGYVAEALADLIYNLGAVFKAELFPSGEPGEIDVDALRTALINSRHSIVRVPLAANMQAT